MFTKSLEYTMNLRQPICVTEYLDVPLYTSFRTSVPSAIKSGIKSMLEKSRVTVNIVTKTPQTDDLFGESGVRL